MSCNINRIWNYHHPTLYSAFKEARPHYICRKETKMLRQHLCCFVFVPAQLDKTQVLVTEI